MPRKFPNLTIHFWRFFYNASRKPSKPKKVLSRYAGKISDEELNRLLSIVTEK